MTENEHIADENQALRDEVISLRTFIDSMLNVMEAIENAPPEFEILELLEEILTNARNTINASDGSLLVVDEDTEELVFVLSQGTIQRERLRWRRLPPGTGIAGWVATHRRATVINDARTDERFYRSLDDELDFETRSVLAAPILGGGRVLGVIEILNKSNGRLFSSGDQTLLSLICRFAGELLHNVIGSRAGESDTRQA